MLLAVHNGGGGRQLQQSQLPYPLPATVLAEYQARLCRQISASSYDGSTRSIFVGCGANHVHDGGEVVELLADLERVAAG